MGNCCGTNYRGNVNRGFLTKDEKMEMLKDYQESLEKEAQGVAERIKEMKNN